MEEICSSLGLDCQLELEVDGKENLRIEGSAGSYRIRAPKEHMIYRGLLVLASQLAQGETDIQIHKDLPTVNSVLWKIVLEMLS